MDPYIRYRYVDGRHDRTVEAPCSSAHPRIAAGVARPLAGKSTRTYLEWCENEELPDGEQPDVGAWDDDGGAPEAADPEVEAADPEVIDAIDLRETPLRRLGAALDEVDDPSILRALATADDRKGAAPIYAARMEAIDPGDETDQEATEPEAEAGDG